MQPPHGSRLPTVRYGRILYVSSAVRSSCQPAHTVCHARIACCSTDLIDTRRIVGCPTATAIASASAASFLPLSLNDLTNSAGMRRTAVSTRRKPASPSGPTRHKPPLRRGAALTVRKERAVYTMPTLHKLLSWIWADGPIEKPRERLHDSVHANGIVTGKRIDDIVEPASLAEPRNESVTRVCQCVEGYP